MKKILPILILAAASIASITKAQHVAKQNMPRMNGKMEVMDSMMSGMSAKDRNEMKLKLDKIMAMPPAKRMKAMQKMCGMEKMSGTMSGKSGTMGTMDGMGKMMSGMSAEDKSKMKMMMDKMRAMAPADRMAAMHKMDGMGMMGEMQGQHNGMSMHSMTMGMSGMGALKGLSGKEYDIAFLSQMIAHHQGAVDMAQQTLNIAKHAETKKEAHMVITAQTKEISQMTTWLRKWYGVKPSQKHIDLMKADMGSMSGMKIMSD